MIKIKVLISSKNLFETKLYLEFNIRLVSTGLNFEEIPYFIFYKYFEIFFTLLVPAFASERSTVMSSQLTLIVVITVEPISSKTLIDF